MSTDPFAHRAPTSHERLTGKPWDDSYRQDVPPPWEIGRPQPAVERLAAAGAFTGGAFTDGAFTGADGVPAAVLDIACGTGENALFLAGLGVPVVGVDVAETALHRAREKARARGLDAAAAFRAGDALRLADLGRTFGTVLDCALFHTFDEQERTRYAHSLAAVTEPGGRLYVICFSDRDGALPEAVGPHPVSRATLTSTFGQASDWGVETIRPEVLHASFATAEGLPAWLLAAVRR